MSLVVTLTAMALILLATSEALEPRLFFNPSASAPRGWYWRTEPLQYARGERVFVRLPEPIAASAAERGYLPATVPLLKPIAAIAGDWVCERGGGVEINGVPVARALREDGAHRPLVAWTGCRRLRAGEFFLLSDKTPDSFDSRYFGPVSTDRLLGKATPLWVG